MGIAIHSEEITSGKYTGDLSTIALHAVLLKPARYHSLGRIKLICSEKVRSDVAVATLRNLPAKPKSPHQKNTAKQCERMAVLYLPARASYYFASFTLGNTGSRFSRKAASASRCSSLLRQRWKFLISSAM
tara:strand:+ start:562 stop:954 length:393 start_codon:yes stop_codon:yes gene_type:complete